MPFGRVSRARALPRIPNYSHIVPPDPPVYGYYGPGITGDELGNTRLGFDGSTKFHYLRFKALASGNLTDFIYYYQMGAGYGAGTGGTFNNKVYLADASGHPTGASLATQAVSARSTSASARSVTFATPATLVSGTTYCLVWEHTDSTGVNYGSFNSLVSIKGLTPGYSSDRYSPKYLTTDFAHAYAAAVTGPWTVRTAYMPVIDLHIGSTHQGNGYAEANYTPTTVVGKVNGASEMVREQFTASSTFNSIGAAIRLGKISGTTADLRVSLRDSGDSEIAFGLIPASNVQTISAPDGSGSTDAGLGRLCDWAEVSWSAGIQAITSAQQYYLRLSSSGGTYYAWVLRRLTTYNSGTYFNDGYAQKTTDGTNWSSLGVNANVNDLQFVLKQV